MQTRMTRIRPAKLLLSWVLLGVWLAAANLALGLTTSLPVRQQGPLSRALAVGSGEASVQKTAGLSFLDGHFCRLEKRLFADAADGRLDQFSLLEAALIASGVEETKTLQRYRQRQAALLGELRSSGKLTGPPRRRAQVVFEFMHGRVLHSGYHTDCTDLRTALDQGRFNCVSASVLFNCLAGEQGLAVCGLEIPGHAMSRLALPGGPLDVETTCPRWFQLMGDPQKQAELVQEALGRPAPADRAHTREVSHTQLTAMIYYNRGVDLLAQRRFDRAATANAKALRLDPRSATARGNLLATINNWAIALSSSNRYAEAIDLLREGIRLDPGYESFTPNYVHVHHQWVEHLCRAGEFEEALDVLARAAAEMPDREYFRRAAREVSRRWARNLLGRCAPERAHLLFGQDYVTSPVKKLQEATEVADRRTKDPPVGNWNRLLQSVPRRTGILSAGC